MKEKIRTFSIDAGDGEFIFKSFDEMKHYLLASIDDYEKAATTFPEPFGDEDLNIQLSAQFKYTEEELDKLPER